MNIVHYLDTNELIVYTPANDYVSLGKSLINGAIDICLKCKDGVDKNMSEGSNMVMLNALQCIVDPSFTPSGSIRFTKQNGALVITGDSKGLSNFGQGLINIFTNAMDGSHLHLDYIGDNGLVAPSECDNVIFDLP